MLASRCHERLTRRRYLHSAAGGVVVAALTACSRPAGTAGQSSPGGTGANLQNVHLQIWWPYGSHNIAVEQTWAAFQKQHPTWTAEITFTNGFDKFLTNVAAGTAPDVYMPSSDFVLTIAYKGIVRALDQYIAADKVDMNQYFPGVKLGSTYKGKTYGMPEHMDVGSLYQNNEVVAKVGIDPTKAPVTWDDLALLNKRLVETGPNGLSRLGFDPGWGWPPVFESYLQANGVPLLSADGENIGFDTPAAVEALEWVQKTRALIGDPVQIANYRKQFKKGIGEALANGKLGMELMGVWDLAYTIYAAAPEAQISQFAMPGGPSARGKTFGYFIANFTVLPTDSKQPDAAWAYMRFTASPQGQLFVQRAPGAWDQACIPSVADDPESLKAQPWRRQANKLLAQAKSYSYFPHPGSSEIDGVISKIMGPFLDGTQGVGETMTQLKQQVPQEMAKYK